MLTILRSPAFKFFVSVGGIYFSYIAYGLYMEKLYNHDYSGLKRLPGTYEKFSYAFATSIFQNFFCWVLAFLVNRLYYGQKGSKMDLKSEIIIGACNFWSVFLASQALAHISFPIQALMKSSKIISILIVSFLIGSVQKYNKSQYFCGFIITLGILLFYITGEKKKESSHHDSDLYGLVLITVSLFCDGLLGTKQGEIKKKFKPSSWDQMESLNKWSGLICLAVSVVSMQVHGFINFVTMYPAVVKDLVIVAVLGTCGQIFIFYTIYHFSPLVLSIVTTTRKFFTVMASVLVHGHIFNTFQWISVILVFVGVTVEMLGGDKHKKEEDTPKIEKQEAKIKSN